jgi:autotransporter-associated beta strand protein
MMRQLYGSNARKYLIGLLIINICFFAVPTAQAVNLWWYGTSASWNAPGNWSTVSNVPTPSLAIPGTSDDVIFNMTAVNGAETVTLDANQLANSLTFNNTGTTALTGGSANRTLTLGTGGITVNGGATPAGAVTIGSVTSGLNAAITLGGSQMWQNNSSSLLTIANTTTGLINTAQTLTFDVEGTGNITTGAINSGTTGTLNITKNGTGTLLISNTNASNIGRGVLTINNGTVQILNDTTVGGLTGTGSGILTVGTVSKWFNDYQINDSTFSGQINNNGAATLGVHKYGGGTLTFNSATAMTFSNTLQIHAGALVLDFANMATPTNMLATSYSQTIFTLDGGNITIKGKSGAVATSQTLGNLALNTGTTSSIVLNPNGGTSTTLTLGTVPNNASNNYYTLNIDAGTGTINSSSPAATLGYSTFKDALGVGFTSANGTTLTRLLAFTALPVGVTTATVDYNVTASTTRTTNGAFSVNTLTIDSTSGAIALDLGGSSSAMTITTKGLLTLGSSPISITNGSVGVGAVDTYVHTMGSGVVTISTPIGGTGNIVKDGTGTLTLSGATSVNAGRFSTRQGTTILNNYIMTSLAQDASVGLGGNDNGTLTLEGTTQLSRTGGSMFVGDNGAATGILNIQDTASMTVQILYVGGASSQNSTASGTVNQSGGTVTQTGSGAGNFDIGGRSSASALGVGVYNLSGGTVNTGVNVRVGDYGTGTLNISGSGIFNASFGINFVRDGGTGTINLNSGGTLNALYIGAYNPNTVTTFNFNGGTLKPTSNIVPGTANIYFFGGQFNNTSTNSGGAGIAQVNVRNGGAIIDTASFSVITQQIFSHSNMVGDAAIDGGLTKQGYGTLTLSNAANTYTGPTSITGDTLALTGTASINNSSGIVINGYGAKFLQTSSVASTPPITITNGTLDGTTTVGAVSVANSSSNIVTNGNGGYGTFTLGSLSFGGAAAANVRVVQSTPTVAGIAVSGALSTTPANGQVTITPTSSTGLWNNGTYDLIKYGSFVGGSLTNFTLVIPSGLNSRQTVTLPVLALDGSNIAMTITGDSARWTGLDSNIWATGLNGTNKNWRLVTVGTPTDYLDLDPVLFNDAGVNTAIDLGSYVNPGNMTFNNSGPGGGGVNYSITSGVGYGINGMGSLTKSGAGSLIINTWNSYTGGTVFNGGTLNIGNSGALGTGTFTVGTGSAKMLDNIIGSDLAMYPVASQNWNDDFTFTGTNSLDMGGGIVTLTGGTRTVTVNNGSTLTVGRIGSAASSGIGLTVSTAGTGTLAVRTSDSVTNGNSSIDGTLTVNTGATLQINTGTTATDTADFIATGLAGAGTIVNGGGLTRWLFINTTGANTFTGVLANGSGVGALGLSKSGAGSLTLTNLNTYSDVTTINSGTIVAANAQALGTGNIQFPASSTGTLEIALDAPTTLLNASFGTNTTSNITFVSNVATPGFLGVTHTLPGNGTGTVGMGGGTITIAAGANVLGGSPAIALGAIRLSAGSTQTTTFIPTTAAVYIASVDSAINNQNHTLELAGTGSGTILGDITQSTGTLNVLKSNTSTWTLLGNSSYTGTTTINAGVLNVGNGGFSGALNAGAVTNYAILNFNRSDTLVVGSTITGTGTINQNGSGSLVFTGSVANPVNVNSGTLDGTGSIGATTVVDRAAVAITNGNGGSGALTLASLTFSGDAAVNVRPSSAGLIVTGALTTTPAFGTVTVNPTPVSGIWADGANNLIRYGAGSAFALGGGNVMLGAVGGTLGPRQAVVGLQLADTNGDLVNDMIQLNVSGDTPKWTGGVNNQWNTTVMAPPRNWRLITAGTTTNFITGDKVVFDDSATGPTAININAANVQVLNTAFNNSMLNYTIGSTGGFGIANWGAVPGTLTKNGMGSVTITTNNTYTGATTVNAGTLTLAGANISASTAVNYATLKLDFSAATAPAANILLNTSSLTLGGASTLNVAGNAAVFNNQTVASTTMNAGASAINLTTTGPGLMLTLGPITKAAGATLQITKDALSYITTTTPVTNNITGPAVTFYDSTGLSGSGLTTGYTYATDSGGGVLAPFTGATNLTTAGDSTWAGMPSGGDGTINYDISVLFSNTSQGYTRSVNTIRYLGAGASLQGGTATNTLNGLINAGGGELTVSSPVAIGASNELVLNAATANITMAGTITGGGRTLTITGPNTVTISGVSSDFFTTYVNSSKLVVTGSLAGPLFLDPSTLDGTGVVGALTVGRGSTVTNGNGGSGTLTAASMTFQGAAGVNAHLAAPSTPAISVVDALATTPANGQVVLNAYGASGMATGMYDLIGYGSFVGMLTDFTAGPTLTNGRIINGGLIFNGNNIAINVTGFDSPKWTGALGGQVWSTTTQALPKNWKLITAASATDYIEGDTVLFDDNATNYTVNIPANVSPTSVTFNNSNATGKAYTLAGAAGIAGTASLTKNGLGTVTLNNVNSYSGATVVTDGTLAIGGTTSTTGLITVGNAAVGNPILTVSGTLNANLTTRPSIIVGAVSGSTGALKVTTGGSLTTVHELWLGADAAANPAGGATVTMDVSGGSVTAGNWFVVGWGGGTNGNTATLTQTGGSITVTSNRMTIANGANNSFGTYDLSGTGTFSGTVYVGENGTGTLTVSGSSATFNTAAGGVSEPAVYIGRLAGAVGTVNLNTGGTIATRWVGGGAGTSTFNFNGGTLQATASDTTPNPVGQLFMTSTLTAANVKAGGAVIDTNGFDVTIAQILQHDPALVATADGGLTKNGAINTLTLTGVNTYTGTTTVNDGILELTSTGQIATASAISTAATTATFQVDSGTHTVGTISGIGNTNLLAGSDLTATSVTQGTLTLGDGATLTIGAILGGYQSVGSISPVPEPATWAMLLLAAMGLGIYRRRSR